MSAASECSSFDNVECYVLIYGGRKKLQLHGHNGWLTDCWLLACRLSLDLPSTTAGRLPCASGPSGSAASGPSGSGASSSSGSGASGVPASSRYSGPSSTSSTSSTCGASGLFGSFGLRPEPPSQRDELSCSWRQMKVLNEHLAPYICSDQCAVQVCCRSGKTFIIIITYLLACCCYLICYPSRHLDSTIFNRYSHLLTINR